MKFFYGLSKDYDVRYECEDYIALMYKIEMKDALRGIYEPAKDQKDSYFVSATESKHKNTQAQSYFKIPNTSYRFLPMLRQNCSSSKNVQRDVVVITASSGSGKTTLITRMSKVYRGINPDNKIYFISSKNMAIDPSFDARLYTFISFSDFMELFPDDEAIEEFTIGNQMDNSLLIFDDIVLGAATKEGKEEKGRFYKFLSVILNLKRMNYISLIYCTHETSDYSYTRNLFNETTVYITFNTDLKNRSNLILVDHLKLNKSEITRITNAKSRWVAVLTRPRAILTETEVIALN